ncbi:MAG: hypothetical protein M0Q87_04920 [Ottowia sp.]|nr:hypothetical protein [Ottowia sp.]
MSPTPPRHAISLNTAAALSGLSVRTWQRRVEQGQVPPLRRPGPSQQTLVPLAAVQATLAVTLGTEDAALLVRADHGEAAAQADVGALLARHALQQAADDDGGDGEAQAAASAAAAIYFLEQAAAQGDADAMHWLGTLHAAELAGRRGQAAESLALMWTARAAAHGHVVARQQMDALKQQLLTPARGA